MKKVYYIGDWARKGVTVDWSRWTRQAKAEAVTGRAAYLVGWTSFSMPAISSGSCACTGTGRDAATASRSPARRAVMRS